MSYASFIAAAYIVTLIVLLALVAWVVLDGRRLRRRLANLEERGIRRRSASRESGA